MSYISKVKLPDNSEFDLNAAKINGHDPAVEISYDDYLELTTEQKNSEVVWCVQDYPSTSALTYDANTKSIIVRDGAGVYNANTKTISF